jgi:hypothetical protein
MAGRQSKIDTLALGRLTRHEVCNPFRLSTAAGIPGRSLYNAVEGISPLTVPDLRLVLGAMVALDQEEDALELVRGLLDLNALGWDLRHAPRPAHADSLAATGLHAAGAAGEAVAGIAEAAADGTITTAEAGALEPLLAHARHMFDRALSLIRGAPRGQASLPGLGR